MKNLRGIGARVARTVFPYATIKVLLSAVILVFAATISIQQQNFQTEYGTALIVNNKLLATDRGFSLATAGSGGNHTTCSSSLTFGTLPGIANTPIIAGHLVYDVRVNTTTQSTPNTQSNVTLYVATTSYGPVCIATPASPAIGQIIDCQFDVGATLPNAPYSFRVQVG